MCVTLRENMDFFVFKHCNIWCDASQQYIGQMSSHLSDILMWNKQHQNISLAAELFQLFLRSTSFNSPPLTSCKKSCRPHFIYYRVMSATLSYQVYIILLFCLFRWLTLTLHHIGRCGAAVISFQQMHFAQMICGALTEGETLVINKRPD